MKQKEVQPYSDNVVFLDTEFTDLDIRKGQLLSIGLVKMTGEELYIELEYDGEVHPWVEKNVLPLLSEKKVKKEDGRKMIRDFLGDTTPYVVAYVNQFDAVYWYDFFGSAKDHPAFWIPIDFAGILFGFGYSPDSMGKDRFFSELGIDRTKYKEHNALEDARLLREVYRKFYENNKEG